MALARLQIKTKMQVIPKGGGGLLVYDDVAWCTWSRFMLGHDLRRAVQSVSHTSSLRVVLWG